MKPIRGALALACTWVLVGCDIPTEAPVLEQRWILPIDGTIISVSGLLPTGVTINGNAFDVTVEGVTAFENLGKLCPACAVLDGQTAQKPAFDDTVRVVSTLPAGVQQVKVQTASMVVRIVNGFNFDPIRPGGGATGTLLIRVRDVASNAILGQLTLDGATESLPPGFTIVRTLPLTSGSTVGSSLRTTLAVNSPTGDPTTISTSNTLSLTATPTGLKVSSATVSVAGRTADFAPVVLDVKDIDSTISHRIESGAIVLDVTNPFGVAMDARVDIDYPGGTISKNAALAGEATSSTSIPYTGDEFRSFLGESNVTLRGSGTIPAGAPAIELTPDEKVRLDGKIDLTLKLGG